MLGVNTPNAMTYTRVKFWGPAEQRRELFRATRLIHRIHGITHAIQRYWANGSASLTLRLLLKQPERRLHR